jgi:hypothetical protein
LSQPDPQAAAERIAELPRLPRDEGGPVFAALERLVAAKGLTDPAALAARKEAWAEAYRHTPHGKPVELAAGLKPPTR